ncbi:MAG TPA: hypothetical protein VHL14_04910 [Steroidobacteraceae bacterium]|jgi:hypothetical protein|nr:hypothetical protein [Steroidobacteraceae bacterium]
MPWKLRQGRVSQYCQMALPNGAGPPNAYVNLQSVQTGGALPRSYGR